MKSCFRLTVMPALLALYVAFMNLPPLNILRVDARGMGHEHAQPWRTKARGLLAPMFTALTACERVLARLVRLKRHPLFSPAAIAVTILLVLLLNANAIYALPVVGVLTEGQHAGEFLMGERADGGSRENVTVLSGQDLEAGDVCGRVTLGIGRVSIPTVVGTGDGTATVVFAGPEVEVGSYVLTCTSEVAHGGVFSLTTPSGKTLPALTLTAGAGNATAYTSRHINFTITDGSTDFDEGDVFTFVVSTTAPTVIGGTGTGVMTALSLGPDAKPGRYQVINRVVVTNGGDFEIIGPDGDSIGRFIWDASGSTAAFTSRQVNFTLSDATDYIADNYFDIAVFNQLAGGKVVEWDPTTFDGRHIAVGVLYDNVDATAADTAGVIVTRDAVINKGSLIWNASRTSSQKESAYGDLAARGVIAR
jgi:hypothetical protein